MNHYYSSWRAQLHFELSNVVNGQKIKKLLTLNEAQKNLWAKYGPIAVKLLTAARQSRWIFKQLHGADLKVNADKFDILHTLTEYLEALTSNRPQSNKV